MVAVTLMQLFMMAIKYINFYQSFEHLGPLGDSCQVYLQMSKQTISLWLRDELQLCNQRLIHTKIRSPVKLKTGGLAFEKR